MLEVDKVLWLRSFSTSTSQKVRPYKLMFDKEEFSFLFRGMLIGHVSLKSLNLCPLHDDDDDDNTSFLCVTYHSFSNKVGQNEVKSHLVLSTLTCRGC